MDIEKLLGDYGRALAAGDVEALVECYGFPCTALSDDFVTTYSDADELRVELEEANEYYASLGASDVRYELLVDERISERITRVRVRWLFLGADGAELLRLHYEYTLRGESDPQQIHVVLSIDESHTRS
jgi:hypothetical protein